MSEYHVLVTCPLIHDAIDDYADRFAEHDIAYDVPEVDQQLTEAQLLEIIDDYDGVIAGDDHFTAQVIESAARLKVIAKWGIGTDNIDHETAEREGVAVYNTPGAFDDEVADVVVGYAVMLARDLHQVDNAVREGEWYCPRGSSLAGRTAGIVGVGSIGTAVARRLDAMGMDLLGHDVVELPNELVAETSIEPVGRKELFERASLVSLNCPLTAATRQLVGSAELAALGTEAYLINTARGELVDQPALVNALQEGTIAGAALDVFADEPLPADNALTDLENVVLGSHNAQNTHEAVSEVNDRAVENVIQGLLSA